MAAIHVSAFFVKCCPKISRQNGRKNRPAYEKTKHFITVTTNFFNSTSSHKHHFNV